MAEDSDLSVSAVFTSGADEYLSDDLCLEHDYVLSLFNKNISMTEFQRRTGATESDLMGARINYRKRNKLRSHIMKAKELKNPFMIVFRNGRFGIGYDNAATYLALGATSGDSDLIEREVFSVAELRNAELLVEKEVTEKEIASSKLGSAIIGGALAGPGGAIIGALVGKGDRTQKTTTVSCSLIINFINTSTPPIAIPLPNGERDVKWTEVLNFLIKKRIRLAHKEKEHALTSSAPIVSKAQLSAALTVKKIASLSRSLTNEKISEAVFQKKKSELLSALI